MLKTLSFLPLLESLEIQFKFVNTADALVPLGLPSRPAEFTSLSIVFRHVQSLRLDAANLSEAFVSFMIKGLSESDFAFHSETVCLCLPIH